MRTMGCAGPVVFALTPPWPSACIFVLRTSVRMYPVSCTAHDGTEAVPAWVGSARRCGLEIVSASALALEFGMAICGIGAGCSDEVG
jgi:hypothetical protein